MEPVFGLGQLLFKRKSFLQHVVAFLLIVEGSLNPTVQLVDPARRLDFQTSATVHHLNYFHQPESAAFVRKVFGF